MLEVMNLCLKQILQTFLNTFITSSFKGIGISPDNIGWSEGELRMSMSVLRHTVSSTQVPSTQNKSVYFLVYQLCGFCVCLCNRVCKWGFERKVLVMLVWWFPLISTCAGIYTFFLAKNECCVGNRRSIKHWEVTRTLIPLAIMHADCANSTCRVGLTFSKYAITYVWVRVGCSGFEIKCISWKNLHAFFIWMW